MRASPALNSPVPAESPICGKAWWCAPGNQGRNRTARPAGFKRVGPFESVPGTYSEDLAPSMNILLLNQFFYPDSAATSQLLTDLARDLVSQGHSVRVI